MKAFAAIASAALLTLGGPAIAQQHGGAGFQHGGAASGFHNGPGFRPNPGFRPGPGFRPNPGFRNPPAFGRPGLSASRPFPGRSFAHPRHRFFGPPVVTYFGPTFYDPWPYYYDPYVAVPDYVYEEPPVVYESPPLVAQAPLPAPPPPQSRPPAPQPAPPAPQPTPAPRTFERMTLSASELFEFDRSELSLPQPKLEQIAAALNANPQITSVRIIGYTDRLGSKSYNRRLSQRRADAVKMYLVSKGVAASRLVAMGRGEADPIVFCEETDRQKLIDCLRPNRRVVVEPITLERPR